MEPDQPLLSDEQLARQAQAGSAPAFEELVHRYEARIYRFVLQQCRSPADAQEITQDTFVSAASHLLQFDANRSFGAWLFAIARRKCIDRRRANQRRVELTTSEPVALAVLEDPAALLVRQETRQDLWRQARNVLPELQFQALWLRYAEDLSVADIARVLRKTSVHVKVLLFRARTVLARELHQPPSEEAAAAATLKTTGKRATKRNLSVPAAGLTGLVPGSNL